MSAVLSLAPALARTALAEPCTARPGTVRDPIRTVARWTRMLVAEDSNLIRTRISRVVQNGGLSRIALVGLARSGAQAVRIARCAQPEVVTVDLSSSQMGGMPFVGELLRVLPRTKILVFSARVDRSTFLAALKFGARGVVPKPFSDDQFRMALLDVMEAG